MGGSLPRGWLPPFLGAAALLCACTRGPTEETGAAPPETARAPALDAIPARVAPPAASPWLLAHFDTPLAPQGADPASLAPATCGACHPRQYADWSTSRHAAATGPGVLGQLLAWDGADDAMVDRCQACHAPLAEQDPTSPAYAPALREAGVSCAACHLRAGVAHGPPMRGEAAAGPAPHASVVRDAFRDPAFCASCHDFGPGDRALGGKLLQETGAEWARTEAAAAGLTCQGCHMPDGRHLWRGVHDPETVRRAVGVEGAVAREGARLVGRLEVENVGAGHRLPTYATARIGLVVEQLDAGGRALAGTRVEGAVARHLAGDLSVERFDTRLLPGERHALVYDRPVARGATAVRLAVECAPEAFYARFFARRLVDRTLPPAARRMLERARSEAASADFVVWERVDPIPSGK